MSSLAVSVILISTSCHKLNMTSVNLAGNNIDCLRDGGGIFSPGYDYFCQRLTGSLICSVKTHDGVSRNADYKIPRAILPILC